VAHGAWSRGAGDRCEGRELAHSECRYLVRHDLGRDAAFAQSPLTAPIGFRRGSRIHVSIPGQAWQVQRADPDRPHRRAVTLVDDLPEVLAEAVLCEGRLCARSTQRAPGCSRARRFYDDRRLVVDS